MACDICGKNESNLTDLRLEYQTDRVKQICSECVSVVDAKLWDLRAVASHATTSWLKRFIEERRKPKIQESMTASEAVYGFAAWLTTREDTLILGRTHDASAAGWLANEWCEANGLPPVRDIYPKNIVDPK